MNAIVPLGQRSLATGAAAAAKAADHKQYLTFMLGAPGQVAGSTGLPAV